MCLFSKICTIIVNRVVFNVVLFCCHNKKNFQYSVAKTQNPFVDMLVTVLSVTTDANGTMNQLKIGSNDDDGEGNMIVMTLSIHY